MFSRWAGPGVQSHSLQQKISHNEYERLHHSALPAEGSLDEIWHKFEAEDKWVNLRSKHPVVPPSFQMPRAMRARWSELWDGPGRWRMVTLRIKADRGDDGQIVSPEKYLENEAIEACQMSMHKRAAKGNLLRSFGCQVLMLVVIIVVGLILFHGNGRARKVCFLAPLFVYLWVVSFLVFSCSWIKVVTRVADLLFFWLACTYDQVARSGEQMNMRIRRHILLSVLGLLHCRDEEFSDLAMRLDWGRFKLDLPYKHSFFPSRRHREDGTVESNCLFVDGDSNLMRFVWFHDVESKEGKGLKTFLVDHHLHYHLLSDPKFEFWVKKDMAFVLDIQSQRVTDLVNANPWWAKLEFQLRTQQSRIDGFRNYLGDQLFNRKDRFVIYVTLLPLFFFATFALHRHYKVFRDPSIYTNTYQMLPFIAESVGVSISSQVATMFLGRPRAAKIAINMTMRILEKAVRKDWALIWGMDLVDDADACADQDFDAHNEDSIPRLWQITTCRTNMKRLAGDVNVLLKDPLRYVARSVDVAYSRGVETYQRLTIAQ